MTTARRWLCCLWLLVPGSAAADAVPPPPAKCPKGQLGITSHGGPECVEPPPKSCPAGWRGVIRGQCVVHSCATDAECGAGKQCRAADVCLHEFLQEWGWGASLERRPSPADSALFAEPPQHFSPPRRVVQVVDICRADRSCPSDWQCAERRVCLPSGVAKPGYWPDPNPPSAAKPKSPKPTAATTPATPATPK